MITHLHILHNSQVLHIGIPKITKYHKNFMWTIYESFMHSQQPWMDEGELLVRGQVS